MQAGANASVEAGVKNGVKSGLKAGVKVCVACLRARFAHTLPRLCLAGFPMGWPSYL